MKRKYKVTVCGHFGGNKKFYDGQTIKTKSITEHLKKIWGDAKVVCIDTWGGIVRAPLYLCKLIFSLITSENIVILPAQNGVKVLVPFLIILNRIFHKKIHYVVIGGWLPELLSKNNWLGNRVKKLQYVYVETSTMKQRLEKMGFGNVIVLPNFKNLYFLTEGELCYEHVEPYKICTFSRVMKEKGIEDIVFAIESANAILNRDAYKIDIYGKVDEDYKEEFETLMKQKENVVTYKGVVESSESVNVLKKYFFLAFPTRFYTEGIPGTIIDAYAAGIPVVSSRWESFSDIIDEGLSGIGYSLEDNEELVSLMVNIANNPSIITSMKRYCLQKAILYTPEFAMKSLEERL